MIKTGECACVSVCSYLCAHIIKIRAAFSVHCEKIVGTYLKRRIFEAR